MKRISFFAVAGFLVAFGLLTTFLTSSIIFDLFNIRSHEGNYVLLVVWANLVSGLLYLTSAVGFIQRRGWAALPLIISVAILVLAFFGLLIHINGGGAYETKTVFAMLFRIAVNVVLAILVYRSVARSSRGLANQNMLLMLPVLLVLAGCGHSTVHEHNHESATESAHDHDHDAVGHEAISLNNGEKWEADEHTMVAAEKMKTTIAGFQKDGAADYKLLADTLKAQLNALIAGCTMEGPAHDALHQWLVPFTAHVKHLSEVEGKAEGITALREVQSSLDVFEESFR